MGLSTSHPLSDTAEGALAELVELLAERWSGRVTLEVREGGVKWMSTETVKQGSEMARRNGRR